jgi:hypothetical protein
LRQNGRRIRLLEVPGALTGTGTAGEGGSPGALVAVIGPPPGSWR